VAGKSLEVEVRRFVRKQGALVVLSGTTDDERRVLFRCTAKLAGELLATLERGLVPRVELPEKSILMRVVA
jgi:hypothetical protein